MFRLKPPPRPAVGLDGGVTFILIPLNGDI